MYINCHISERYYPQPLVPTKDGLRMFCLYVARYDLELAMDIATMMSLMSPGKPRTLLSGTEELARAANSQRCGVTCIYLDL